MKTDTFETQTVVDELLDEQRRLTAVDRFSRGHRQRGVPLHEKYYRDLIPFTQPGRGEQYSFEVDLDACSGCKACVTACHRLNGLDADETWRDVGTLIGGTAVEPLEQIVTTACHHCVDPACLNGCPVDAYEKDPATGIVRHLDDQCIGCQYCIMTCPYEAPKYSAKRGIVRKCDMCQGRLAIGEAPACVQACPNEAISIRIVKKEEMIALAEKGVFLPDAPDPGYTVPTTAYKTIRASRANLKRDDHYDIKPAPAHPALVTMLVLTQFSVGICVLDFIVRFVMGFSWGLFARANIVLGFGMASLGLTASLLHLGRPLLAWRSFLGWRHSWLSREIIAFAIFLGSAAAYVAVHWAGTGKTASDFHTAEFVVGALTGLSGLAGVFCSVMVYHDTRRLFWNARFSAPKFFGTTLLLGLAGLSCTAQWLAPSAAPFFARLLIPVTAIKLLWEFSFFRHSEADELGPLKRSSSLMCYELRRITALRFLAGMMGGIFLPLGFLIDGRSVVWAGAALGLCFFGEILERYLFFVTVAPAKMPGTT